MQGLSVGAGTANNRVEATSERWGLRQAESEQSALQGVIATSGFLIFPREVGGRCKSWKKTAVTTLSLRVTSSDKLRHYGTLSW